MEKENFPPNQGQHMPQTSIEESKGNQEEAKEIPSAIKRAKMRRNKLKDTKLKEAMSNIKAYEMSQNSDKEDRCAICMDSKQKEKIAKINSCDHTYCTDCIKSWSKHSNTCPICKQEFNMIKYRGEDGEMKAEEVEKPLVDSQYDELEPCDHCHRLISLDEVWDCCDKCDDYIVCRACYD